MFEDKIKEASELIALTMILKDSRRCECLRPATQEIVSVELGFLTIVCDKHVINGDSTELAQARMARRFTLLLEGE